MFATVFQCKVFCSGQRKLFSKPLVVPWELDVLEDAFKVTLRAVLFFHPRLLTMRPDPKALVLGPSDLGDLSRPLGW